MRIVTAAEMRDIDRQAIEDYGIPGVVLMENAGLRVIEVIQNILSEVKGKVFTILVGKGNNGGDGLVIARHLFNRGALVKVLLMAEPEEFMNDAGVNLTIWKKMGQPVYQVNKENGINLVKVALLNTDIFIDALFGTGFHGMVNEKVARIIELINASSVTVIAVDIPSGLEADTGRAPGPSIKANHTVTFGLPKLGLVVEPGASIAGELHVVDISLPKYLTESKAIPRQLLTKQLIASWFKPRRSVSHKGIYGHVLLVAGSRDMSGAARMAARGALRAGAGLVTLAVPQSIQPLVAAGLEEAMTKGLAETEEGTLSTEALEQILEACQSADVLALGPGITTHPETIDLVRNLLPKLTIPVVLDADALNALAGASHLLEQLQTPAIITPHPGEMSRLLGLTIDEVQEERLYLTGTSAKDWNLVVLLKGAKTIIGTPEGEIYINPTGNPGMATGGSGDALTGIIASLVAQGFSPTQAAAAGAYLHGYAGDLAAQELSEVSTLASDLVRFLPATMKAVLTK
ncbi:carbohydrate kinase, YjeF related protein [Desulforamulus reducens MI-1]|uniref:Bifunctional NAD(P)H-hydrate repair enzyme n=1 Tax=Desulforamulus reducens (strain ATCC BAA-1160 / DSM 100696 / MI-1) TaxID=349161 RepID=A4J8G8_DESRM|nr:NAD(P)H-hydrate dehydratase [Desulforamulus reducens]ABO51371.1 carbohydrate kinase, YjeF related protein [Desulforamulus reducens MI-1]